MIRTRQMRILRNIAVLLALVCVTSPATGQRLPDVTAPLDGVCDRRKNVRISPDDLCHFFISGVGAASFYAIGRKAGLSRLPAAAGAAVLMGGLGFAHETGVLYGSKSRQNRVSRRDLAWNSAGIVVGISVADLWLGRRGDERGAVTGELNGRFFLASREGIIKAELGSPATGLAGADGDLSSRPPAFGVRPWGGSEGTPCRAPGSQQAVERRGPSCDIMGPANR